MHRRHFLRLGLAFRPRPGVRLLLIRPTRPLPAYTPVPDSWSTGDVEVASPMSIYPEYKAKRSLFMPASDKLSGFNGSGGPGGGTVLLGAPACTTTGQASRSAPPAAVNLALWDLIGNALGMPVYRFPGGERRARIAAYCTPCPLDCWMEGDPIAASTATGAPGGARANRSGMRR